MNYIQEYHSNIYIRKNNGPSIEPCGTPVVIYFEEDFTLSISTYCDRLVR